MGAKAVRPRSSTESLLLDFAGPLICSLWHGDSDWVPGSNSDEKDAFITVTNRKSQQEGSVSPVAAIPGLSEAAA